MKISSGGIGTVASAMSSSKAHHAAAASAYPDDWAWSCDFDAAGTAAAQTPWNDHGFTFQLGGDPTQEALSGGNAGGVKYILPAEETTKGSPGYNGFEESAVPSTSGNLKHGETSPNGNLINLVAHKYLTVYFQIILPSGTLQPTTAFGTEFFWSSDLDSEFNGVGIVPLNTVRKTGSHQGTPTSGAFADREYISISYDMSTEDDRSGGLIGMPPPAGKNWVTDVTNGVPGQLIGGGNLDPLHLGGSIAGGWPNGSIIVHGYVLSGVWNNNEAIASIALPIQVS